MIKKLSMLFINMFKIGLFTFGGGYAMIALFQDEFVERKKILTNDEFLNLVVVAEATPGPIAINMSTYVGYKKAGIIGAILATLAICLPSFIIIYLISLFLDYFLTISIISAAFKGIRICVIYLIFMAGFRMYKKMEKHLFNYLIFSLTLICMILFSLWSINFQALYYILISGFLGVLLYAIKRIKEVKK